MTLVGKLKLVLVALKNKILLLGNYKLEMSPELFFLYQYHSGKLNRYDLIVRYLMIDYLLGKNDYGKELYLKMQLSRASGNEKLELDFLNKEKVLRELTVTMQQDGFRHKSPLISNKDNGLCDGAHRLAAALYFKVSAVTVVRSQDFNPYYGMDFFEKYFNEQEIKLILQTEKKIFKEIEPKKVLTEILNSQKQKFGRGMFYQSFEEIDIAGQRPTEKRFKIYRLEQYLTPSMKVLDIGSNCGFFAAYISRYVKHVEGLEINQSLVDISNMTKLLLGMTNTNFRQGDFNKTKFNTTFDFILSFAVHYWIGLKIEIYARRLWDMLNTVGFVLLESQNIEIQDVDWDEKVKAFIDVGFVEVESGSLCDDNKINRNFSLLKKG